MLSYFPRPYKNETIYSIAARYATHMGIVSKRTVIKETFNIVKPTLYEDYIGHINILVSKIKHFSNEFTEEYFLDNHTISPLYAPFMNKKYVNYYSLGIFVKNRKRFTWEIPEKEHLFYCSECVKEQLENYGECYWNRIFQIPGVMICSEHKKTLKKLNINIKKNPLNKFIMPNHEMHVAEEIELESKVFENHLEITRNIEYFFINKIDALSYSELYSKYFEFIKVLGIAIPLSDIKRKLSDLILSKFNEETLDSLNSNPLKNDWLSHLSEERIKDIHPIRHVILMMALSESVHKFLKTTPQYQPFETGPWLCMNPLSQHYLDQVISSVNITFNKDRGDFQGLFSCNCGFTYVLYAGEMNPCEVKAFQKNRVKAKGEVWESEFDTLVSKGTPIKDIAQKTNQSKSTVLKRIREGHTYLEMAKIKKKQKFNEKKLTQENLDKEEWIKLINNFPNSSRTELIDKNKNLYSRLSRYDKNWLDLNLPSSQRGKSIASEDLNHKRDLNILKKAKEILKNWSTYEKQAGKIIKKTQYALYTRIGMDMSHKETYPITANYISTFIESKEDYQIRLINQCIENHFKYDELKKYKILMISGLRNLEPKAEIHLENILKDYKNF